MKQTEVFKKIGGIIRELNEQYEYLQGSADNLNDLELELFVANTHFLKDHAEILRKLNAQKAHEQLALPKHEEPKPEPKVEIAAPPVIAEPLPEIKKPVTIEPKYFEPVVQPIKPTAEQKPFILDIPKPVQKEEEPITFEIGPAEEPAPQIDLHTGSRGDSYSFEREEPETIRHELILDDADTWEDEDEAIAQQEEPAAVIEEIKPEPIATAKPAKPESMEDIQVESLRQEAAKPQPEPVNDSKPLTLNQRLSAQLKDKSSAVAGAGTAEVLEPLADIKTAIMLNDKMLFVKDLFNGYNLAYTEAIEIVNRFTSFEEADRFLRTNYVTKNNWEAKKTTADKFYALLRRRYA